MADLELITQFLAAKGYSGALSALQAESASKESRTDQETELEKIIKRARVEATADAPTPYQQHLAIATISETQSKARTVLSAVRPLSGLDQWLIRAAQARASRRAVPLVCALLLWPRASSTREKHVRASIPPAVGSGARRELWCGGSSAGSLDAQRRFAG